MESQATIEQHLKQAFYHLTTAVNQSLQQVMQNEDAKQRLGAMWEAFLVQFFDYVKKQGKINNLDMLGWIPKTKLTKLFLFK
ncbi:hypothetical protein [Laceyella putida]|jgi:hypothetical protein|uniref:Uncharacterized protein n=1 Tax=Laceyella putida TaxID=110101 RepID=A0ABW2RLM2_9BACL